MPCLSLVLIKNMLIELVIYLKIKRDALMILSLITLSTVIDSLDFASVIARAFAYGGQRTGLNSKFFA